MQLNPLLIKSSLGVVAVGGTSVTGYIYRKELSDMWNADNKVFLVQANNVTTDSHEINAKGNYCSLNLEFDNDCQIIDLGFNEKKYVETQTIINSSASPKTLTNNSFYKLIVNRWNIKSLINKTDVEIEIKNRVESGTKSLAKLKIISTMYDSTLEKPIDTWTGLQVLVQADETVVEVTDMNLSNNKCRFLSDTQDVEIKCDVYKFENHSTGKHVFNFSKIKKLTKFNEIQAGQYYILDFNHDDNNAHKTKINDESIKNIFIKKDTTKKANLTFKSKIITNFKNDTSDYTNAQALLLNDFEKNESNSTYIIAKSETVSDAGFNNHANNYKCELSSKTDPNCIIIELTDKEKTLLNITNADKTPSTINTADKYFKVITSNEVVNAITDWSTSNTIIIKSKATDNSTEYGKLKALYQIENGKITKGKTKLLIATAKEAVTTPTNITTSTQFQCTVENSSTSASNCDVYKFSDSQFDLINFSKATINTLSKATNNADWAKGKVFLINLNTPEIDHSKTTEIKNVTVKVTDGSSNITKLTIDAHLFSSGTFDGTNFSNLFALK